MYVRVGICNEIILESMTLYYFYMLGNFIWANKN